MRETHRRIKVVRGWRHGRRRSGNILVMLIVVVCVLGVTTFALSRTFGTTGGDIHGPV
jgi:hypothetical protein